MVVRLDLHQDVRRFGVRRVASFRIGIEAAHRRALHHRGVVGVGDDRASRIRGMRVPDHREEALRLANPVDPPVGVEDLVPAMLGVRLREHRELDIGRIAAEPAEARVEIVDLVVRQRKAERRVRLDDRRASAREQRDRRHRSRREMREQRLRILEPGQHRFGHPVVQQRQKHRAIDCGQRSTVARDDAKSDSPLDSRHRLQPAASGDVGCLRRPRRHRARARDDDERLAAGRTLIVVRTVRQQAIERRELGRRELSRDLDKMPVGRGNAGDGVVGTGRGERGFELGYAERRQRMAPA